MLRRFLSVRPSVCDTMLKRALKEFFRVLKGLKRGPYERAQGEGIKEGLPRGLETSKESSIES